MRLFSAFTGHSALFKVSPEFPAKLMAQHARRKDPDHHAILWKYTGFAIVHAGAVGIGEQAAPGAYRRTGIAGKMGAEMGVEPAEMVGKAVAQNEYPGCFSITVGCGISLVNTMDRCGVFRRFFRVPA